MNIAVIAHDLKVHLKVDGDHGEMTCDDLKEGDHGLTLIDADGINSKIGSVPYERLQYVRLNKD